MRLSIRKRQHQQLLLEVASQLRSDDPKDALEHILNCWISPCQTMPQSQTATTGEAIAESPSSDLDIEIIADWS